jgi:hypothetical protein
MFLTSYQLPYRRPDPPGFILRIQLDKEFLENIL